MPKPPQEWETYTSMIVQHQPSSIFSQESIKIRKLNTEQGYKQAENLTSSTETDRFTIQPKLQEDFMSAETMAHAISIND